MSRSIKSFCWVYASKKEIFKEWISGVAEGSFAVGKRYVEPKKLIKYYGFSISPNGRRGVEEFEDIKV